MKVEAGKYYRTRDGKKAGPMKAASSPAYPWSDGFNRWTDIGRYYFDNEPHPKDLIAEWIDEPTKLRDMTDAEIGALVRAGRDGRERQASSGAWCQEWTHSLDLDLAYRLKPEPEVRTQVLTNFDNEHGSWLASPLPPKPRWRVTVTWTETPDGWMPKFGKPECDE